MSMCSVCKHLDFDTGKCKVDFELDENGNCVLWYPDGVPEC